MAPVRKKSPRRSWAALGLPDWCLEAVTSMGFAEPTPSQAAAIPLFLANSDVVVEAPTGSGKSLAFLLPLAARLLRAEDGDDKETRLAFPRGHVVAVVLAPTRELADQLYGVLVALLAFHQGSAAMLPYGSGGDSAAHAANGATNGTGSSKHKHKKRAQAAADGQQIIGDDDDDADYHLRRRPDTAEAVLVPQLVVGGTSSKPADDMARFVRQGSNVLVGTPGRLAALLASRTVNSTASFAALVLDEADRLLDLGFAADLQRILAFVPKQRRTFLCSASVNDAIGELIKVNLRNPKRVVVRVHTRDGAAATAVAEKKTPASLVNTFVALPASRKLPALLQLLAAITPRPLRTLVFVSSCFAVKYFAAVLPSALPDGYAVVSLHGKLEPHVRERAFAKFLAATSPCVLLTTDVASRGLDVPQVDLVVNLDPPTDPKTFLHRCGRTGRAGRRGLAVTMLHPGREADDYVAFLAVRQTPVEPLADALPALAAAMPALTLDRDDEAIAALSHTIRQQVLADRDLHDLGQRAFVSWARAFQEHQARSIFRVVDLDWPDLGRAWGLARLPKMPELRAAGITDRALTDPPVDVDAIAYRDKAKESRRQANMAAAALAREEALKNPDANPHPMSDHRAAVKRNASWSARHDRDDLRGARRDRKRRKREAERRAAMTPAERAEDDKNALLIAQIRRKNEAEAEAAAQEGEFTGFAD